LLRDDMVANLQLVVLGSTGAKRNDLADELMPGGDGWLAIAHAIGVT
jgi:hypothetical protein